MVSLNFYFIYLLTLPYLLCKFYFSYLGGRFDEHFVLRQLCIINVIPKLIQSENKIFEMVFILDRVF